MLHHSPRPCPCHGVQVAFDAALLEEGKEYVQDKIILQTETGSYELVLKANLPKPSVKVVGDLNYGIAPSDSKATKRFQLVNDGTVAAPYRVDFDK